MFMRALSNTVSKATNAQTSSEKFMNQLSLTVTENSPSTSIPRARSPTDSRFSSTSKNSRQYHDSRSSFLQDAETTTTSPARHSTYERDSAVQTSFLATHTHIPPEQASIDSLPSSASQYMSYSISRSPMEQRPDSFSSIASPENVSKHTPTLAIPEIPPQ